MRLLFLLLVICNITFGQTLTEDTTFVTGTGFDNWSGFGSITVDRVLVQPDNKIIVVGQYINYNGLDAKCIIRLNSDGTKDTTFNAGTGTNAGIWGCLLQSDGKIIIYGGFTSYNGVASNRIVRLNSNGTKDTSFNIGTGPNDYLETVKMQSDGKFVIGGRFTSYNGTTVNRLARINANGTFDSSFIIGTGADNRIRDLVIQSDGKVIVGGDFLNYNGVANKRIVRLNTDGTIDATYNTGTGALNNIWTMALQLDGKLIIGGDFQAYNGIGRNRIARINTDGTLDTTFTIGTGANSTVMSLLINSDEKIYIGGSFLTYNNTARTRFARLNSDGTLDTTLTIGTGFDDWVKSICKQADNKLVIGGNFTTFNDGSKNRAIRMTDTTLGAQNLPRDNFEMYPNPTTSLLYIKNAGNIDHYTIMDINGQRIENTAMNGEYINVEQLQSGTYILILKEGSTKIIRKFIKN
ncbi:MAG: T9SS type A sorting domain-containing protein [Flavobacterium sp.]|nr:T9SS type A sorting domain-containing protein [Flavobacterium sp.]